MSDIEPQNGEYLVMCEIGTSFIEEQNSIQPRSEDVSLVVYRSNSDVEINLFPDKDKNIQRTVEWTVEFWFKYSLDQINKENYYKEVLVGGHDLTETDLSDPCV